MADGGARGVRHRVVDGAQARASLVVADAEDDPHDHLQREVLCARQNRDLPTVLPPIQLGLHQLRDHIRVCAHPLAMERRQQQLAPCQVLIGFEQEQDRSPRTGRRMSLACRLPRGSPVNIRWMASRSTVTTLAGMPPILAVKVGPYLRRASTVKRRNWCVHRCACTTRGVRGPGGSSPPAT